MTIDKAIKHAEEVAEEKKAQAWEAQLQEEYGKVKSCKECAEEHRQLAEWLKDYKRLKEQESCEDAISRQAVLEIAKSSNSNWIDNSVLFKKVNELPPVTPKPKMGHWIFDEVLDRHYYCSECKSMGVDYWDYCPNCGAKMQEVKDNG